MEQHLLLRAKKIHHNYIERISLSLSLSLSHTHCCRDWDNSHLISSHLISAPFSSSSRLLLSSSSSSSSSSVFKTDQKKNLQTFVFKTDQKLVIVRGKKMVDSYLSFFLFFSVLALASGSGSSRNLPILSFDEGYSQLFGDDNLMVLRDGKSVHLSLDERTGSGFVSQDLYLHGFFSASIKLPADYTAGVVVAFYMSNGDMFEKNHDELDFEFLGNIRGKNWRIQTNVYGNGSTNVGREERYGLSFDPSEDFHQYSILWTENQIIFYVDNVPIREIKRTEAMGGDFPSKPMSLYATIWDGSNWATNGGKYRVNYKYAPYITEFSDLVLHGCAIDPVESSSKCDSSPNSESIPTKVTPEQRTKMVNFRKKQMQYSYCYDKTRYTVPPPECVIDTQEAERLRGFDPVTFGGGRRHHGKRHHRSRSSSGEATSISI